MGGGLIRCCARGASLQKPRSQKRVFGGEESENPRRRVADRLEAVRNFGRHYDGMPRADLMRLVPNPNAERSA